MKYLFHGEPQVPPELQLFTFLNTRKILSPKEEQTYHYLQKGYIGERNFFNFLNENLPENKLLLNSLRLRSDNSEFQLDSLLFGKIQFIFLKVKTLKEVFLFLEKNGKGLQEDRKIINQFIS